MSVFNWLWTERQWVFSGAGVVIIAAIWKKFNRSRQRSAVEAAPAALAIAAAPPKLKIEDVVKEVKSRPPLQRSEAQRHYVGLRVNWEGRFVSASNEMSNNNLRLLFRMSGDNFVFCNISRKDYPWLAIVRENAPIQIEGEITGVDGTMVGLGSVKLTPLA